MLKEDLSSHISFTNNCIADLQTALEENSEAGKVTHCCFAHILVQFGVFYVLSVCRYKGHHFSQIRSFGC